MNNTEQIEVLNRKQEARDMINIWHGNPSNWINMIKELSGNGLDIFKKNKTKNNKMRITINNSNDIEYEDNGSGIPVEIKASDGTNGYEAIFERPFAGTNYHNKNKTVGQHGVYLFTLSMTSEDIEYFIGRPDGNIYNIAYHKGDRVKDLSIVGKTDKTFTKIRFSLDKEVWELPNFTFDNIKEIVKGQSSLEDVTITLEDKENNVKEEYYYKNGIVDYFNELVNKKSIISDTKRITDNKKQKLINNDKIDDIDIDLLFNFSNDSLEPIHKDFLNTADLIKHGTIRDGILLGFKNGINSWIKANGLYNKNEKQISIEDVFYSLNYICNTYSLYPKYSSQIKQESIQKHYKPVFQKLIEDYLETYFVENPVQAKIICNQILTNKRANEKAEKTKKDVIKKLSDLNSNNGNKLKIENLNDCNFNKSKVEDRIFLVCEGLSAMSGITSSYNNDYMGVLGLKGRFISSLKKSVSDVLNNVPAYTFIKALGCGIEIPYEERKQFKDIKTFDKSKLRYGNIGILTDADCFGSGIRLSLLTFIYKYMPELLKEGRVYIIITPRYEIKLKNGEMIYVYNDREKDELFDNKIKKEDVSNISIVKGLGEMNSDDFWNKVLCEEARKHTFIQVDYDETEEMVNKLFEDYMGKDTQPRKEFVNKFIANINLDEIN